MSDDDIFEAALEEGTYPAQVQVVHRLCGEDSRQATRVERLLELHWELQSSPAAEKASLLDRADEVFQAFVESSQLNPGQQVGNYKVCQQIGEGATSLVYQAHTLGPLKRDVALKLLKPGMDSRRILARFALEHQVLLRLEHSGIVRIFDAGVQDNGRPFFAMELVPKPVTITNYAHQFGLNLRQRIGLMITVCEIVQHAHQRGIIHRDLKPSNILLEGKPQTTPAPKIIDFGIAKIVQPDGSGSTSLTTMEERFGTPAYMSPEQALLPVKLVDVRSDVYSLGVILYELLTGRTPRSYLVAANSNLLWTSSDYWDYPIPPPSKQLARSQQTSEPIDDSPKFGERISRAEQMELDAIARKMLARDLDARYQSVADFQRDLQRFLDGQHVDAAGPGWLYRTKKFVKRHRLASAAALLFMLTIVTSSILTTSFAIRARLAEQQANKRLEEIVKAQQDLTIQRDNAEKAKWKAQAVLRSFQVRIVMDKTLSRYLAPAMELMSDARLNGNDPTPFAPKPIDSYVFTKPHDRLIVRGDWSWTKFNLLSDIANVSYRISSREAAAVVATANSGQATDSPPSSTTPVANPENPNAERNLFQSILLEELKLALPQGDPFIGEVLDNCGVAAMEKSQWDTAESFFRESVDLWAQASKYPANLAQAQLFLAETLLKKGERAAAEAVLREAQQTLDGLANQDVGRCALMAMCTELSHSCDLHANQ